MLGRWGHNGACVREKNGGDTPGDGDGVSSWTQRGGCGQVEGAEGVAVLGHGALALEDLDVHAGLVVDVGGEDLGLLGGDSGVALDRIPSAFRLRRTSRRV